MTVTAVEAPERPAHRDPNVLRWLGAYTASMVGDSIYFMALAWAAARTGSASGTGLVLAAGSIPRALLMLGGGVLADRLGPRRVVIGSDAARAVLEGELLRLAGPADGAGLGWFSPAAPEAPRPAPLAWLRPRADPAGRS